MPRSVVGQVYRLINGPSTTPRSGVTFGRLPPEAAHFFLSCWIRLYGLLCMEVLHQLDFAYTDPEPVFEECLRDLAAALGLDDHAAA